MSVEECVMLAAGASSRMGAWKPLLPFRDGVLLDAAIGAARKAGLKIILVTGFRGDELASLVAPLGDVRVAYNPHWEDGQIGSVLTGARAAKGEGFLLTLADMPLIRPATYLRLLDEADRYEREGQATPLLFATYRGRAGHPVLIPRTLALAAENMKPSGRMRDYLASCDPGYVECDDPGILVDVDTVEDYRRLD